MAYPVNENFRSKLYGGSSEFRATLTLNGTQIPNSQIASIKISSPIVDKEKDYFYIGTFLSQKLTIKFKNLDNINVKSGDEISLSISQYVNNEWVEVPIGVYLVDELAENYHKTCEINCLDYAIKFKPNIDYSPCFTDGKATVGTILNYICEYFDVELGSNYPLNDNIEVGTYDSTVSGKQWISYIAEVKGCNAKMDREGRLIFVPLTAKDPVYSINAGSTKAFEIGEKYRISQVTYFDAIRNYTYGTDTNNTLFIRQDNPFVTDTIVVENIFNVVNEFEAYSVKNENFGDFSLDAWDLLEFTKNGTSYTVINDNTLTYQMSIMTKIEYKIPSKQQEITTNVVEANIRTVKTTVDNVDNFARIEVANINETLDSHSDSISTLQVSEGSIISQVQTMQNTVDDNTHIVNGMSDTVSGLDDRVSDVENKTADDGPIVSQLTQVTQTVQNIQNLFQVTGGSNYIRNSAFLLPDETWSFTNVGSGTHYHTPLGQGYSNALIGVVASKSQIKLMNTKMTSVLDKGNIEINVKGIAHSFNYYYKMDNDVTGTIKLINSDTDEIVYQETLTSTQDWTRKQFPRIDENGNPIETFITDAINYRLEVETTSTYNDRYLYLADLMLNSGEIKSWEPSNGELSSTIVKMSLLGIQVISNATNIATLMSAEGFGVYPMDSSGNISDTAITSFDDEGLQTGIAKTDKVYTGKWVLEEIDFDNTEHHIEYFRGE